MDNIRPGSALLTGIPGGMALAGVPYLSGWLRDGLLVVGMSLSLFAVVLLFFWARDMWISQACYLADNRNRLYKLAQEARHLTPEQLAFVTSASHIGTDISLEGESFLHGTDAPLWFVAEFLGRSFSMRACPVRSWSEGTDERAWAQQITAVLINAGYALPAAGNTSAPWANGISPDIIAKKLGIPLPHPTPPLDGWQEVPA